MLAKDLKKFGLFISSCLTGFFAALINIFPQLIWREILNPLNILISFLLAIFCIYQVKCYSNNLLIANNNDRIKECQTIGNREDEIQKLQDDTFRLKRENSKIDLFF